MTPEAALTFCRQAHAGQVDKSGLPYWEHPARVYQLLANRAPEAVCEAALLHDVLEDTAYAEEELRKLGVSEEALRIICIVTRIRGETYAEFIQRIACSGVAWAIRVKLADIADNLSRPLPPEMAGLHRRYRKARIVLIEALGQLTNEGSKP